MLRKILLGRTVHYGGPEFHKPKGAATLAVVAVLSNPTRSWPSA